MPKASTSGPIQAVPCPHCDFKNDCRVLGDGEAKGGSGWGSQGLETGAVIDCDNCKRFSKIIAIETIQVIKLAPAAGPKG
jgi:hypothetical protein